MADEPLKGTRLFMTIEIQNSRGTQKDSPRVGFENGGD